LSEGGKSAGFSLPNGHSLRDVVRINNLGDALFQFYAAFLMGEVMIHIVTRASWQLFVALVFMALIGGCGSSSTPPSQGAAQQTARPIPPDSPLAKVKEGMGVKEVEDLLGQPTDTESYMTGKGFNPFYYGGDTYRMMLHYKGMGRVTFTREHAFANELRVMEDGVEYDPNERGYK
jgi:hypothetical protein